MTHAGLRLVPFVAAVIASGAVVSSQVRPDARALVERLHAYLERYEPRLSELVADEDFRQRTTYVTHDGIRQVSARRRLRSDVGFLRLPGGLAWLGQRSVRAVDDRPVPSVERLEKTYSDAGAGLLARARAIADANASFNLGHPRSLNLPTLPLDLLERRRTGAFDVSVEGRASTNGRPTTRVLFRERAPGAIVAHDDSGFVRVDVRAWLDADGALHRADVALFAPDGHGRHDIRVDFVHEQNLGMLVPVRLTESFRGRDTGGGVATYSKFRAFRTSGRLVPPPP